MSHIIALFGWCDLLIDWTAVANLELMLHFTNTMTMKNMSNGLSNV